MCGGNTDSFRFAICLLLTAAVTLADGCGRRREGDYPIRPVPFTDVRIEDAFWLPRLETNRTVTIPYALGMCEETGRIANFDRAAGTAGGPYQGRRFNDTDVYKTIEGAAYTLALHPNPGLESELDDIIRRIAAAREPDGYLYPARTVDPANPAPGAGPERWVNLNGSHELYNSGHLFEAAVAYSMATGKNALLQVSLDNADLLVHTFGPDGIRACPGHQEVEIGLAKLYRQTGRNEYLRLARYFLNERGRDHDTLPYPEDSVFAIYNGREYMQDHLPVLEQTEAVGHAVRATYMYSGMADVAALSGDSAYIKAIDTIWENVVSRKLYLTGGVGARHTSEAFGDDYELPNWSAYTETCAAIGNALWNHRMFLLHGDSKYLDVLERIIYNGMLSGVSLSGNRFFYRNPLESRGGYERSPWFEVACCPPNLMRFLPSIPGYVYALRDDELFINLFIAGEALIDLDGDAITLRQETLYPWNGRIKITVDPAHPLRFTVRLRIPGWARNRPVPGDLYRYLEARVEVTRLYVNGSEVPLDIRDGFARIRRRWKEGDTIELYLAMPVRRAICHEAVEENRGKVALERGPIVYCIEEFDNGDGLLEIELPDEAILEDVFEPTLLGGITAIQAEALHDGRQRVILAIPYYAWANRDGGEMAVWLRRKR